MNGAIYPTYKTTQSKVESTAMHHRPVARGDARVESGGQIILYVYTVFLIT
jgi:hypothetical protein